MFYHDILDLTERYKASLEEVRRNILFAVEADPKNVQNNRMLSQGFREMGSLLNASDYKCFTLSAEQAQVFLDLPIEYNAFTPENLKAPFEQIFINIEGRIHLSDGDYLDGIFLTRKVSNDVYAKGLMPEGYAEKILKDAGIHEYVTIWGVNKNLLKLGTSEMNDGEPIGQQVHYPFKYNAASFQEFYLTNGKNTQQLLNFIINFYYYCNSVNMEIMAHEYPYSKKRARQHRAQKQPYYTIDLIKKYRQNDENLSAPTGITHSYRYDVRGHFMHFHKGKMAGRVFWCPPHQRGLKNELYIPSVRRV